MLNCWEAEPANRPSFTQLKADTSNFMVNNRRAHFIQFPGPESLYDDDSDLYNTTSPFMTPARGTTPAPEQPQAPPLHSNAPILRDMDTTYSEMETRRRRHLSAPIMEGAEWNENLGLDNHNESGDFRKRASSNTNPYVGTPRRGSSHKVRRSFEWLLEPPPIITIQQPVITIGNTDEANS